MRPHLAVSLLFLCLLISEAQGIRLHKRFMLLGQRKAQEDGNSLTTKSESGAREVILCKDGHCSGKNRKLISTATSPTTTTTKSKNDQNKEKKAEPKSKGKPGNGKPGEEENFTVDGSPSSEHREIAHEHFPDIIDIAEMDYSPAKRKPPIHN